MTTMYAPQPMYAAQPHFQPQQGAAPQPQQQQFPAVFAEAAAELAQGRFPYRNRCEVVGQVWPSGQKPGFEWRPGSNGSEGHVEITIKLLRQWGGRNAGHAQSKNKIVAYGQLGQTIMQQLQSAPPGAIIGVIGEVKVSNYQPRQGPNAGRWQTSVSIQVRDGRNGEVPFAILGVLPIVDHSPQQQRGQGNFGGGGGYQQPQQQFGQQPQYGQPAPQYGQPQQQPQYGQPQQFAQPQPAQPFQQPPQQFAPPAQPPMQAQQPQYGQPAPGALQQAPQFAPPAQFAPPPPQAQAAPAQPNFAPQGGYQNQPYAQPGYAPTGAPPAMPGAPAGQFQPPGNIPGVPGAPGGDGGPPPMTDADLPF